MAGTDGQGIGRPVETTLSKTPPPKSNVINAIMTLLALAAFIATCMQLSGCAHRQPLPPEIIYVPTPVPCPAPPILERPGRTLALLPDDAAPDVVVRAAAVDLENLESTLSQCRIILQGYGKLVT